MNKFSVYFKIAAAIAAAPLFFAISAVAAENTTYSHTTQSDLVLQAIDSMRAGRLEEFRSLLDENALNLYGSEQGMHDLKDRFERLSGGTRSSLMNTKTQLGGTLKADTLLVVSNRIYSVDVVAKPVGEAPIWNVSVHCIGASVLDSFGLTDNHCRITEISISHRTREGSSDAQSGAGVLARNNEKQLGDETVVPGTTAPGEGTALGAGGSLRN